MDSDPSERAPKVSNLLEIARNQRIGPRALSGYPGIYLTPRGVRSRLVERHMAEKRFQTKNPPKSRILVHAYMRFGAPEKITQKFAEFFSQVLGASQTVLLYLHRYNILKNGPKS